MHVGHGRGAATGDAVARLLDAAGAKVTREYYINDAGVQVGHLAHSVYVRAQELVAAEQPGALTPQKLGADDYPGEYIVDVAKALLAPLSADGRRQLATTPFEPQKKAIEHAAVDIVMRTIIRPDLELFNIRFDLFFSERAMHEAGAVVKALDELQQKGLASMERLPPPRGLERDPDAPASDEPLLVMKTTQFGDDVDRPLRKPDGSYTYFAGDVAYHWDKLHRGFNRLIDVWGADHGGYVPRVRAAIQALGHDPKAFEVILVQMVNLMRNGEPVKMGKRSGNFVTLREVIEEAGPDATRFFFLMRSGNSQLDFDLALATKQTEENPVFYVQYGHARACSILRKAAERGIAVPPVTVEALRGLGLPEELDLVRRMLSLPDVVAGAAKALEPHRVIFYLQDTLAAFHSYLTRYKNTEKVLGPDPVKTAARLALVEALRQTLRNSLLILGVSAPERMDREVKEEEAAE
jgi:arginyl-tRNA synthetase